MASSEPLLPQAEDAGCISKATQALKAACKVMLIIGATVFVAAWILQGVIFYWATTFNGCSASSLEGYKYPGGGVSDEGGAAFNLVPRISLLAERKLTWYGQAFDVIPSSEASTVSDAPAGTWWRTWGPIFYTYTYEDIANSKTTAYMRSSILKIGMSHKIFRCDGEGPTYTLMEGAGYLTNRVRKGFGMTQGFSFKVFAGNEKVALIEETNLGYPSLTFRNSSGDMFSSAILQTREFHKTFDQWLVKSISDSQLPYFVPSAATLLLAMHTINTQVEAKPKQLLQLDISGKQLGQPVANLDIGSVVSSVGGAASAVGSAAESAAQAIASTAEKARDAVDGAAVSISEAASDAASSISNEASGAMDYVGDKAQIVTNAYNKVSEAVGSVIAGVDSKVDDLGEKFTKADEALTDSVTSAGGKVLDALKIVPRAIGDQVEEVHDGLKQLPADEAKEVNEIVTSVADAKDRVAHVVGSAVGTVQHVHEKVTGQIDGMAEAANRVVDASADFVVQRVKDVVV